jgi:hypothetical protein
MHKRKKGDILLKFKIRIYYYLMKFLLLAIFLLLELNNYAQWPKVFGHDSFDMTGRSIHESYDNGVYITGGVRLNSGSNSQGYIMKTDINGYFLWKRYFSNQFGSNVQGLSMCLNGDLLVSGEIWHSYDEDRDGFFAKLNSCGEKQWCKIIYEKGVSSNFENVLLPDGGFIILGGIWTYSYNRIWLYRIDSEGSLIWKKTLAPDTTYLQETGYNLTLTSDACVLVTGFTYTVREPGLAWSTPFWVKLDLDGNQQWALPWIPNTHNIGDFGRTRRDSKGNFYSGGNYGTLTKQDACIYKFTNTGDTLKHMIVFDQGDGSVIKALDFFSDSTLFLGQAWGIGSTGYSRVFKCDTTGNIIKSLNVPLDGMPVNYSVLSKDNKILGLSERLTLYGTPHLETCLFKFNQNLEYDSAYTIPRTYDSLCTGVIIPEETLDLDCEIVNVSEPIEAESGLNLIVYPNPSSSIITISLPDHFIEESRTGQFKVITTLYKLFGDKYIEIVNMNGRIMDSMLIPDDQTSIVVDISQWPQGMYMVRLINKGKVWAQGKFIKTN